MSLISKKKKKNQKETKKERQKEKKNVGKHVVFHACRATSLYLFAACVAVSLYCTLVRCIPTHRVSPDNNGLLMINRLLCSLLLYELFTSLFTFHLNCKYHPCGLINDMQMSIYDRKHWHALCPIHFTLSVTKMIGDLPTLPSE